MKNTKKLGFRTKNKLNVLFKDAVTYALPMFIGLILLGVLGMVLVLGITVIAPAIFGMVGMAQQGGRFSWSNLSKGQKYGVGGFLVFMSPFILFALVWLVVTSVELWIDAMIVCMLLFLGGYIYFSRYKTSSERGIIGGIMSSKVVLLVGVILLLVILVSSAYTITTDSQQTGRNANNNNLAVTDGGETPIVPDNILNNTDLASSIDTDEAVKIENQAHVVVGAFDTLMAVDVNGNPALPLTTAGSLFTNGTDLTYTESDTVDIEQAYPIRNARITLTGYVLQTDVGVVNATRQKVTILAETNSRGLAVFYNISVGNYKIQIEKNGYADFVGVLVVNKTYVDSVNERIDWSAEEWDFELANAVLPDFSFRIRPSLYKVTLHYQSIPNIELTTYADYEEWYEVYVKTVQDFRLEPVYEGLDPLAVPPFALWQSGQGSGVVTTNWTIDVSATVSNGLTVQDIETVNRYDNWYKITGLPRLGGQMMFGLQNQMQNMLNSYSAGLQSVLPLMQTQFVGQLSYTEETYTGHSVDIVYAMGTLGESVTVFQDPSANSITDSVNASHVSNFGSSKLHYRDWEYLVVAGTSDFDLGFQVVTTFEGVTDTGLLTTVTGSGKGQITTDVILHISDDAPFVKSYTGGSP